MKENKENKAKEAKKEAQRVFHFSLSLALLFVCGLGAGPPANAPQTRRQAKAGKERVNQLN